MAFDETGNGCGPGMWRLAGGGCYTLNELYAYARSMGNGLTCSGRVCEMRPHTFTDDPPGRSSPGSIESTPQPSAANPATPTTTTNDPMGQMTGVPPKKPDTKKAACCGCACGGAPQRGNKGVFTNWLKDAAIEGFAWMALIGGASPSPFSDGTPAPLDIRGRLAELEGEYPVPFMVLGVSEPLVTDPKLQNLVRDLYKGARTQAPIGTGSTADAIRHELATGQQVGGRWHSQKGREYITALTKWLSKNLGASAADRAAAQSIAQDICDALAGK